MAGECYALSQDLVNWVARSNEAQHLAAGKEDKQVAHWMRAHPDAHAIRYESQHCWIYDHPKAGTAYSHGFLYPDHVAQVKNEIRYGIPSAEIARRGGMRASLSYSTVSKWKQKYKPPREGLSTEEEVEALVEGGGRWSTTGNIKNSTFTALHPREDVVFESNDERIRPEGLAPHTALRANQVGHDPLTGLTIYPSHQDTLAPSFKPASRPHLGHISPSHMPLPVNRDQDPEAVELRRNRYLGLPHGGTIVIHYIKKNEWFMETALALIGRHTLRLDGSGGPASEWQMPS